MGGGGARRGVPVGYDEEKKAPARIHCASAGRAPDDAERSTLIETQAREVAGGISRSVGGRGEEPGMTISPNPATDAHGRFRVTRYHGLRPSNPN